ncbi:uncharacterized protein LOC113464050 [Ceratina calcarata]|uniref:Uncharacterized protein LOC113464050 n=1 Tax=Ceratina calcarata TaxID=156304 RepID=A0AAJ7RXE8_9HYME|nr:uncharacterized protein LOC113464050 [Ceratina calcarata]
MRAVLVVAAVLAVVEVSAIDRRPKNCKDVVRNVIMDSCKGPREKRSPQRNNLENLNQQMSQAIQMEMASDEVNQQKRQGMFPPYGYGFPAESFMSERFQETDVNLPGIGNFENRFTNVEESYRPNMPFRPPMFYRSARYATKSVVSSV